MLKDTILGRKEFTQAFSSPDLVEILAVNTIKILMNEKSNEYNKNHLGMK